MRDLMLVKKFFVHVYVVAFLLNGFVVAESLANDGRNTGLEQPTGKVILTISGVIQNVNQDGVAKFDRQMLLKLGTHELRTTTTWTKGVSVFKGVLGTDIMKAVGAKGSTVFATALNDYSVEIPISDFEKYGVVFALWRDGKELTVRNKGPIWPVYPRDEYPELRNRLADKKWIWQLAKMEIR